MKHIHFYLDFISPYAYLAFEELPRALQGLSYTVGYRPILLGAVLQHLGSKGPAEIAGKRDWTYRHALWEGHRRHIPLQMPARHPFNPLALARLAVACDAQGLPNRRVCERIFQHVWVGGADAADPDRLQALTDALAPQRLPTDFDVKQQLKTHTDEAIAAGIFGVPTYRVDNKLFWGLDALPMLRQYLAEDPWFEGPDWTGVGAIPVGVVRNTG